MRAWRRAVEVLAQLSVTESRVWTSVISGRLLARLPVPGQQCVDLSGRMVGDAADDVGEVGLGVDMVELAGLDDGVENRGAVAAGVGAEEGPVATSQRQRADGRSAALLDISRRPSLVKRVSASQRLVL